MSIYRDVVICDRNRRGWNTRQLCDHLTQHGVGSRRTVYDWLAGRHDIGSRTAERIVAALGERAIDDVCKLWQSQGTNKKIRRKVGSE